MQNAIKRAQWENLTSPTTGLPSGKLIEEQLRLLMRRDDWAILYVGIMHIDGFNEAYGFVAGDDVFRFAAMVLNDGIEHRERPTTLSATSAEMTLSSSRTGARAQHSRLYHGALSRRGRHLLFLPGSGTGLHPAQGQVGRRATVPLMTLAVGVVTSEMAHFADIREITEIAAAERRKVAEALDASTLTARQDRITWLRHSLPPHNPISTVRRVGRACRGARRHRWRSWSRSMSWPGAKTPRGRGCCPLPCSIWCRSRWQLSTMGGETA